VRGSASVDRHVKRPGIFPLVFLLCFIVSAAYPAEKENFQFKKQPELQQIKPKKPVRIKLKRTSKDEYSWELAGDDVDEIIKTDKKLRKQLNVHDHPPAR
jgi:hypothetical protein